MTTTTPTCVCCGRPTPDGYACTRCGITKPGEHLRAIADMTPAARDIAHGQSRGSDGGNSGKPGSRLPLNLTATAKLDGVQAELTTWVRHITEQRGGQPRTVGSDPIVHSACYLTAQLEWMRHRPEVDEFLEDVAACARIVGGLARGPREQKYLGPCGLPAQVEVTTYEDLAAGRQTFVDGKPCEGDIYAPVYSDGTTARTGTCRTCRATVATDDRAAWLDGKVRSHAFRAAHIAEAYGVRANTIRVWADRGRLVAHGHDSDGRPLFNVGDVLDLAAADAARRETERAKRDRRAAEKAESEGAAA